MSDSAIVPFQKKLGKLSILILEGYLKKKVGDGFVDELREPYIKQEKLAKALQHTENRFVKLYSDKELAHAMFIDLKQSDRPVLQESILSFLDHPTDPDFPEAIREILTGEFSFLEPERINRAVVTYLNLLTEELSLEDTDFRDKMVALISIRGGDLWANALSIKDYNSRDISPRKVNIILEGDFRSFNRKKKTEFLKTISNILNVDQKQIQILSAKPGSIILQLIMPVYAQLLLTKMILNESIEVRRVGVLSVKTNGETFKYTKDLRIIIVGQGSVGKTSLARRLIEDKFSSDEGVRTDGINIQQWRVKIEDERFKMHVWDFGGQEIMHATHQFFLSKNTLYLLVIDSRLTEEENRLEYWIETLEAFAGESPIIIVGNKIDQHPLGIKKDEIMQKYPNIEDICEVSCATGKGITELKHVIGKSLSKIPYAYLELSLPLFAVKNKLEQLQLSENYIGYDEYKALCESERVFDLDTQKEFIIYLHEMGTVLYFPNHVRLENIIILNPQWVTNGIYKILNSHTLFQNKGVLTTSMLDEILNLPEYPRGKRLFIVDMMKKFELCYDIEPDKTFLVPDLLPKDQPNLEFNGIPAFEYAYPVLPSSVITRFIVRMNQKIDDGFVWRTGVILKIGDNTALVKADIEDRKITIAIDGVEYSRRDALSAIRYELGEIHNSIKGLNPQQRVPVPNAPLAEPLKYDYLLKLERAGQETVLVENGNDLVTVNVRQMLSAIESEAQRKEQGNVTTNYYIQGDVNASGDFVGRDKNITARDRSVIVGGNMSGNLISGNYNKINSAEIAPELKDTLLQLGEAVDAMIEKLPAEQAAEVAEDFGKLADEAVKPKPNKRWYSVSIEGLIKAAENLDKLGTPVISLSRKVLSLLTGGVGK